MTHQIMELYDYHVWANTMKKNRFIDQPHTTHQHANAHDHVPIRSVAARAAEPATMIWQRRWEGGLVQWM
ncbi:hypothetical protein [Paenibacillus guangzhouensis]|uniref:hypothetical protein n=1 Tax=Paenibacillus guangzhouensis TaxID=1473112 RepID=UPI001266E988|nr:hypothetical protein [Paenibacillus guangzhouensis]